MREAAHPQPRLHLVAIIPCLDEEANLQALLPLLLPAVDGVIVVDNGSRDGSVAFAEASGSMVEYEPCRGYGAAVRRGLARAAASGAEIVAIIDADAGAVLPSLRAVAKQMIDAKADLALGARCSSNGNSLPSHVLWGNRLVLALAWLLAGGRFADLGPLRVARLPALLGLGLRDPAFGWNLEMQVRAGWQGLRVVEVPVDWTPRPYGRSKSSLSLKGSAQAGFGLLRCSARLLAERRKLA